MSKIISINLLAMLMLAALAASALAGKNEDPVPEPDSLAELLPVGEATDVRYIDGKLGIGTSSPVANLHVAGSLRADNGMFGFGNSHLDHGDNHDNYLTTGSLGSTYFRTFDGSIYHFLGSVSNEKWQLDRRLEITGGGATIEGNVTLSGDGANIIQGGSNSWILHTPDDGRTTMYLAPWGSADWDWGNGFAFFNNGDFLAYGNGTFLGTVTTGSSRELKNNIAQLTGDEAVEALMSLMPVKYNYKADSDELELGFIAEDVPDLVARNDRKSLSPMDFAALSVSVIQELKKENQNQQQKIESLMERIAALEAAVGNE